MYTLKISHYVPECWSHRKKFLIGHIMNPLLTTEHILSRWLEIGFFFVLLNVTASQPIKTWPISSRPGFMLGLLPHKGLKSVDCRNTSLSWLLCLEAYPSITQRWKITKVSHRADPDPSAWKVTANGGQQYSRCSGNEPALLPRERRKSNLSTISHKNKQTTHTHTHTHNSFI